MAGSWYGVPYLEVMMCFRKWDIKEELMEGDGYEKGPSVLTNVGINLGDQDASYWSECIGILK